MNDQVSFRLIKGNKILNVTFNKMDKISDVEKEAETKLDYLHGTIVLVLNGVPLDSDDEIEKYNLQSKDISVHPLCHPKSIFDV